MTWLYKVALIIIMLMGLSISAAPAPAAPAAVYTRHTVDVDSGIANAALDILATRRPGGYQVKSYAITNISKREHDIAVSVAGLKSAPGADWDLLQDAVWTGYIELSSPAKDRYLGDIHSNLQQTQTTEYIFPWYPDTVVLYGMLGVHEGWGWNAVDWVGGHGCSNCAPNMAYVSKAGTINFVCRDSMQVTIKLDSNLLYAHLQDYQQEEGQVYAQGDAISPLVLGNIPETQDCGHAEQQETHWHIHWGFPQNTFSVESWTLNTGTETWTQAGTSETVDPEEWMLAEWNGTPGGPPVITPGDGGNGGSWGASTDNNFWDMIIDGAEAVTTGIVSAIAPPHEPSYVQDYTDNAFSKIIELGYVMAFSMCNMTIPLIVFGIVVIVELVHIAYAIWRFILKLLPVA